MWRALSIWIICIKYNLGRFLAGKKKRWSLKFIPINLEIYLTQFLGGIISPLLVGKTAKEEALRHALEELGPIFIKFGQILSTRHDMLPATLVEQLSFLQDRVSPCPSAEIVEIIERSLSAEVNEIFSEFETDSCNSASVAQVHYGKLRKEGAEVAVKAVKPGIRQQIKRDIEFLYWLSRIITAAFPQSERLLLVEVVREFEYVLENELNMQQEGANASQLARNFKSPADVALLKVPKVYWNYCTEEVLVLERIYGVQVNDVEEFKRHKIDLRDLAEKGVKIFFTQVFRDSFFHADMHPGNIFVDISDPTSPLYSGVDFGIMGSLSSEDKKYLALNLLAFFDQDYRRVAELHINCGWVNRDTRVEQLEAAVRGVCEPIFAKPLNEIPFAQVLGQLIRVAKRFNMQVQPQLLLLQKTLFNVEGLGRQLYPQLNIWNTATPILKKWLAREVGAKNLSRTAKKLYPELLVRLPKFANELAFAVENINQEGGINSWMRYRTKQGEVDKVRRQLRNTRYALALSLAATALAYISFLLL